LKNPCLLQIARAYTQVPEAFDDLPSKPGGGLTILIGEAIYGVSPAAWYTGSA